MSIARAVVVAITAAWILGIVAMETGSLLSVPGMPGVVAEAEARIGRPLTPVSIAGVARRTVRRCAVGIYNC